MQLIFHVPRRWLLQFPFPELARRCANAGQFIANFLFSEELQQNFALSPTLFLSLSLTHSLNLSLDGRGHAKGQHAKTSIIFPRRSNGGTLKGCSAELLKCHYVFVMLLIRQIQTYPIHTAPLHSLPCHASLQHSACRAMAVMSVPVTYKWRC